MSENNKKNIYSANDALDINELASLNDDITPEFIEQLQNQVAQNASEFTGKPLETTEKDDSELFEEVPEENFDESIAAFEENIDDNFIKKYKAKINKQHQADVEAKEEEEKKKKEVEKQAPPVHPINNQVSTPPVEENLEEISELTSGKIIEKPAVKEDIEYNESLDFVDDNIKYSKYVIYIEPENTEFIESLTVKERKNLINRILREQDSIALTKRRLGIVQAIIKHSIIAVITISISIPVVYWTVNASLEATINNYRRSQTLFKTLYRDKGKISRTQYY